MEQRAPLPTPDTVLNKLKSDGTFDQFRRSCLSAIEAEPSFRSLGEEIEVLTRRFLQDRERSWKDTTTRNEVRAQLRRNMLATIAKPELEIGSTLSSLIEKTLQNKSKDLMPKVLESIESLRAAKLPSPPSTEPEEPPPPPPPSPPPPPPLPPLTTTATGSSVSNSHNTAARKGTDVASFPLPITIPGLNAQKKDTTVTSGDSSASKPVKLKAKPPVSDNPAGKEGSRTLLKAKGSSSGAGKSLPPHTTPRQQEKRERDGGELGERASDERASKSLPKKERDRNTLSHKESQSSKSQEKEKEREREREGESEREREKGPKSTVMAAAAVVGREGKRKEGRRRVMEQKEQNKSDGKEQVRGEGQEARKTEEKASKNVRKDVEEQEEPDNRVPSEFASNRKKQVSVTRRSVRIASLSETKEEDKLEVVESDSETQNPKQSDRERVAVDGNERDEEVSTDEEEAETGEKAKRKEKRRMKVRKRPLGWAGRKKARVLSSSSEDSRQSVSRERDEDGYESETEQAKEEEEELPLKKKRKRKSTKSVVSRGRNSRKRRLGSSPVDDEEQKTEERGRGGGGGGREEEEEEGEGYPSSKKLRKIEQQVEQPHKRKSFNPMKVMTAPCAVVVTRYNRRVKPNRKYSPVEELSDSTQEEEEVEKKEKEEEGEKESGSEEEEEEEKMSSRASGRN